MEITNLKIKLELSNDSSKDAILSILLSDAISLINLYLNTPTIPKPLEFIAEELAVKRFRKIGNESTTVEKIDILSTTYSTDDITEYIPILDLYKINNLDPQITKRKLRTL